MTDYNAISKPKKTKKTKKKAVEETPIDVVDFPETPVEEKFGIVNTRELYVREAPDANATPAGTVKRGDKVLVNEADSTDDFWKVCTESGMEGFCMKKFIK